MMIRPASDYDHDEIWGILEPIIRAGETFALPRDMTREMAFSYWFAPGSTVFVLEEDRDIVGTYFMRPNFRGGGDHIVNCGYMTAGHAAGRGIVRRMCEHSIDYAIAREYRGIQFNMVVSTNERAIALWQGMGFVIIGRIPGGFRHPVLGFVDGLIMYRSLEGDTHAHDTFFGGRGRGNHQL